MRPRQVRLKFLYDEILRLLMNVLNKIWKISHTQGTFCATGIKCPKEMAWCKNLKKHEVSDKRGIINFVVSKMFYKNSLVSFS